MKLTLSLLSLAYAAAGSSCSQFTTLATGEQEIAADTGLPADIESASNTRVDMNFIEANGMIEKMHFRSKSKGIASEVQKVHIHCGIAGQNGALLLEAYSSATGGPLPLQKGRITDGYIYSENLAGAECNGTIINSLSALMEVMKADYTYINIHTADYPSGENRGQIDEHDDFNYLSFAVPREEVDSPSLDRNNYPNSFTRGDFDFDAGLTRIKIGTVSRQIQTATTKIHIHCGPKGVNGRLALGIYTPGPLTPSVKQNGNVRTKGFLTNDDLGAITAGDNQWCKTEVGFPIVNMASLKKAMDMSLVYLNIHTEAHDLGENRGQISEC